MRHAIIIIAALLSLLNALCAADTKLGSGPNILFIGNSYTMFNKLPKVFKEVVASTGLAAPLVEEAAVGGYTFQRHLARPKTLSQIDKGNWDVVILQGNSSSAAHSNIAKNQDFLQGAADLYDQIKKTSPQARVVLFETWARHADAWKNDKTNKKDIGRNPAEMQANVRKVCGLAAAQRNDFVVAPVGDAWELNYKNPKALRLHRKDNSHPEFNGSFLAALVLYATVYHPESLIVPYHGNLSATESGYLQEIATKVMKQEKQTK